MKLVTDSKGRLTCAELFPPNTPFSAEKQGDGSIRLIELVEKDVPVINSVRTKDGFLVSPVKVDRKLVVAAIRADRDGR